MLDCLRGRLSTEKKNTAKSPKIFILEFSGLTMRKNKQKQNDVPKQQLVLWALLNET